MNSDIIIIGSGPGGYQAAAYAAKNGLKVTIIEECHAGGTCLNEGCIPTKTLCHEVDVLETLKTAMPSAKIDYAHVGQRLADVIGRLRSGVEQLMSMPGITMVKGHASFKDAHTVCVGDEEYSASKIIIATGSKPKMPPHAEIDMSVVSTSTEMLQLDHVPESIAIVGAGVIGMEFASIFNSFGSKVTVIEFLKECLPAVDSDIAKRLRKQLEKRGIVFSMQSAVKRISGDGILFERKGKEDTVKAEILLVATGRKPNINGLKLEAAGIEYSPNGITTDSRMHTNVEGIYAIGDVNGRQMLAHAATMQGYMVVNEILGKSSDIRLDIMPAAIFTRPEAACVGVSEDYCKENGVEYTCRKAFFRSNGKALSMNETEGMLKIIADNNDKIIGCHCFGPHAADIVQEISVLMCRDTTISQLADMVHIHPTLGEIIHDAVME
ncbi:dihydrolipoyl dehydrogenase [Prevotella sp. OH937_COT-195]|uniref:dihydrolipoyl dehydrogenase n=1 Tax=Prevotella sp. OH937_COT-195 TaxID=2491051 RepID=UPI000F64922E|nr:dihydrolipoyl dehydrogenase [Prevotella sp. OH937_COT-195]RRD02033.1 dihydrolipoyl dehydrogenase [Prevotella sp. OH937_COT-195]